MTPKEKLEKVLEILGTNKATNTWGDPRLVRTYLEINCTLIEKIIREVIQEIE